jgi:hypothetical protein
MDRESLGKVRQATSIYLGRITNDALDETSGIGTFLDPILGSSDRRGDALDFGNRGDSCCEDRRGVWIEADCAFVHATRDQPKFQQPLPDDLPLG